MVGNRKTWHLALPAVLRVCGPLVEGDLRFVVLPSLLREEPINPNSPCSPSFHQTMGLESGATLFISRQGLEC